MVKVAKVALVELEVAVRKVVAGATVKTVLALRVAPAMADEAVWVVAVVREAQAVWAALEGTAVGVRILCSTDRLIFQALSLLIPAVEAAVCLVVPATAACLDLMGQVETPARKHQLQIVRHRRQLKVCRPSSLATWVLVKVVPTERNRESITTWIGRGSSQR